MFLKSLVSFALAAMLQLVFITASVAQEKDPVLLTVAGDDIRVSEFEAVYKKNNQKTDKQSLEEYLELYIKFRLKVKDALNMGLDTLKRFNTELSGYRRQLAEPYLSDNKVTDQLIKEAFERFQTEVKASHILVACDIAASPADTLKAYKKAEDLRKRIVNGEDFGKLAAEFSDDPSAKENKGDLGYFSAFYMVYPFETAAYNTKVGEVSKPLRTQFGYHLVKVTDKRKSRGEISVAHIMTRLPKEPSDEEVAEARKKIEEIHAKIKAGESFEVLATQFSDDKGSSSNGGKLPAFGPGKMVPEFEEAAFSLEKNGDVSGIVRTPFGFHIIKRLAIKEIGTFDEMLPEIKQKIQRDRRANRGKAAFVEKMKKEYGFKENTKALSKIYPILDSTYFMGTMSAEKGKDLNAFLFKLGDTTVVQKDFFEFLLKNKPGRAMDAKTFVDQMYEYYVQEVCLIYENARLEKKYPEFKLLMQEYHDGILLFDLTDQLVWSKAVRDSAGLAAYYEEHKNDHMWGKRIEATIYSCKDEKTASETRKLLKNKEKKGYTLEDIKKMINESSQLNLEVESGKYSKGDHAAVDQIAWTTGLSENVNVEGRVVFAEVKAILEPQPKELNEVRGLMTSGYQNYLEEQWIKDLREKYSVEVHKEHLSLIK